jgi:hypothetical protein
MTDDASWMLGPFQREDSANPCLTPNSAALFDCPVRGEAVRWEQKDVFNKNSSAIGDATLPEGTYAAGQVLCDPKDPTAVLRRSRDYFMQKEYEITGQVGNVCFLEGLVHFKQRWLLHYGTADSKIAVAGAPAIDV